MLFVPMKYVQCVPVKCFLQKNKYLKLIQILKLN